MKCGESAQTWLPWVTEQPQHERPAPVERVKKPLPVVRDEQIVDHRVMTPSDQPATHYDATLWSTACADVPRPCRFVSCRYHLWVVDERPGRRRHEGHMPPPKVVQHTRVTCALDVAHTQPDGASAQTVGKLLGIVPRRVDQLEQRAMEKLRRAARMLR